MTADRDPWLAGRPAWEQLAQWYRRERSAARGAQDSGDAALAALSDIGLVRRLIDETELEAVRAARRHRKSWAEIATRLGVSRQSAWERWREVDDTEPAVSEPAANDMLMHRVLVPDVLGLSWADARDALHSAGLVGVGPDPDGPPLAALAWPDGVVTDQSPESGALVAPGTAVILWTERGGGSGVREPRRPPPTPLRGREMRDDIADRAVG